MPTSTNIERDKLIKLSKEAKQIQDAIEATTGERPSINDILMSMHQAAANTKVFKHFRDWQKEGYRPIKNSRSYRIWGRPRKGNAIDTSNSNAAETSDENSSYKFFPMCCLFSEHQVERM